MSWLVVLSQHHGGHAWVSGDLGDRLRGLAVVAVWVRLDRGVELDRSLQDAQLGVDLTTVGCISIILFYSFRLGKSKVR